MLTKNIKENKTQDKGVIPFYTKEAFPSKDHKKTKDDDDDSVKVLEENLVSLKLKIDETQGETKMNTFSRKVLKVFLTSLLMVLNKQWNCY